MAIILLIPVICFAVLLLGSPELLAQKYTIPLFFGHEYIGSLLQIATILFIAYIVLLYIYFATKLSLAQRKNDILEQNVVEIKAELYNGQKKLLTNITDNFEEKMNTLELSTNAKLERIAKFNEYTLEKVLKETEGNFEKYKKEAREFLIEADVKDESVFKKLKIWK